MYAKTYTKFTSIAMHCYGSICVFPSKLAIAVLLLSVAINSYAVPPVVDFEASETNVVIGSTVDFTDLTTNAPTTWSWEFPGAIPATSTEQNPSVVYPANGVYSVTLIATNSDGQDTSIKVDYITVTSFATMCSDGFSNAEDGLLYDSGGSGGNYSNGENCGFLISPPCATSLTLTFNSFNTESGYDDLSVYDGENDTAPLIGFYQGTSLPGPITSSSGKLFLFFHSDGSVIRPGFEITWESTVATAIPTADFSFSGTDVPFNAPIEFSDLSVDLPSTWAWNFGDGNTSDLQNPIHTYATGGSYSVELIASNCLGADTLTQVVSMQQPPVVSINPDTIHVALNCGDSTSINLTLENSGLGDLVFNGTLEDLTDSGSSLNAFPLDGVVQESSSETIVLDIKTGTLNAGIYNRSLEVTSNDPTNPVLLVPIIVEIVGDPEIGFSLPCLDFSETMEFTTSNLELIVSNTGCDTLFVANIFSDDPVYVVSNIQMTVPPNQTDVLSVSFEPTSIGTFSSDLHFEGNFPSATVCLTGTSFGAPAIAVDPTSIASTLSCETDSVVVPVTITNTAFDSLIYSFEGVGGIDGTLESVRVKLNEEHTLLTDLMPNFYSFVDGVTGSSIGDGGEDMYDGGNLLSVDNGSALLYSNDVIIPNNMLGSNGAYFTRKYPGLFVFAADINGVDRFSLDGDLGADGSGFVFGAQLTMAHGGAGYKGFVKRVHNSNDPSINHLIIVKDNGNLVQTIPSTTELDDHDIDGLTGVERIYYLLFAEANSELYSNIQMEAIMAQFLEIVEGNDFGALPEGTFQLASGASETFDIVFSTNDTSELVVGIYNSELTVLSNDPLNPVVTIPVATEITGAPNIAFSSPCLDFPETMQFTTSTLPLEIINDGCDTLLISNIFADNPVYIPNQTQLSILPYQTATLLVDFSPTTVGTFPSDLHLESNVPAASVCLTGTSLDAPELSINPDSVGIVLNCGDATIVNLTLSNIGLGDLEFTTSLGGGEVIDTSYIAYSGSGTATTHSFEVSPLTDSIFLQIILNGDYNGGSEFASLYIDDNFLFDLVDNNEENGVDNIINYTFSESEIASWISDGIVEVVVQNNAEVGDDQGGTNSHTVILQTTGVDWVTVSPEDGLVLENSDQTITVDINSADLSGGIYTTTLMVETNDPFNPLMQIPVTVEVTGDATIGFSVTCLDFPETMQFTTSTLPLVISNDGCAPLEVSNIFADDPAYSVSVTQLDILPYGTDTILVSFTPGTVGSFPSDLNFVSNFPDTSVCLTGIAFGAPFISVNPDSINITLASCEDAASISLTVTNTGIDTLIYNFEGGTNGLSTLDSVKTRLNADFASLTNLLPNFYNFSDGVTGNVIGDGGGDMYDVGNRISVDNNPNFLYSNDLVVPNALLGNNGAYFTRKYNGLFVFAADINGVDRFSINGNLGADGGGSVSATVLNVNSGGQNYKGFVKRVYGTSDPSVNHLIITKDNGNLSHTFSPNTNSDNHDVDGLNGNSRIFYLLFAGTSGALYSDAQIEAVMTQFLEIVGDGFAALPEGTYELTAGQSETFDLEFEHENSEGGVYNTSVLINSNDPLNDTLEIPVILTIGSDLCADFTYEQADPCGGEIEFFADVVNTPTSYLWDFGDSNTSAEQNPVHNYTNPGVYTVSLTVENGTSSDQVSYAVTINELNDPVIQYVGGLYTNEVIAFQANASGANSWSWDFGDGNISVEENPSHVYENAGIYNVILNVGSAAGCTANANLELTVVSLGCPPGDVFLNGQSELDFFVFSHPNCDTIFGVLQILGDVVDLSGLNHFKYIEGDLRIENTSNLTNLVGLDSISYLGGGLRIDNNASLATIEALGQITSIEDYIFIRLNDSLTSINIFNSQITSLSGQLNIDNNDALQSIVGLEAITSIGGQLRITDNELLTDLSGLESVVSVGGQLRIHDNPLLIDCSVICDLVLSDSIGGTISVYNNPSNCSSLVELEGHCLVNDLEVVSVSNYSGVCIPEQTSIQISAFIRNNGINPQSNFELAYAVNGSAPVVENTGLTLNFLDTATYTFTIPYTFSGTGDHEISVSSSLPGDAAVENNISLSNPFTVGQTPEPVNSMIPADGATGVTIPVTVSWLPGAFANSYNLFAWKQGNSEPTLPTAFGINQISYTFFPTTFMPGDTVLWRVESVNNSCENSSPVQSFVVEEASDLIVENLEVPNNSSSGTTIEISWDVVNVGVGGTGAVQWVDAVYLSLDSIYGNGDETYLGSVPNTTFLMPDGDAYFNSALVNLPNSLDGNYYIFVFTDRFFAVPESVETNNSLFAMIPIALTPPPDLQVDSVVISPTEPFSGQPATVSWKVTNEGTGPTIQDYWRDRVYISEEPVFNIGESTLLGTYTSNNVFLDASDSYNASIGVTIPNGFSGEHYVHVYTDIFEEAYEYLYDDNNIASSDSFNVILSPSPNLVVTQIWSPDTVSNNQSQVCQWQVSNTGLATAMSNWRDRVYVSSLSEFDPTEAIFIGYKQRNADLSFFGNNAYVTSTSKYIPNELPEGNYYIYIETDYQDQVYESIFETDNISISDSFYVWNPDLTISALSVPTLNPTSGDPVLINWTMSNIGSGGVFYNPIIDNKVKTSFWLSPTPVYDSGTAVAVGHHLSTSNVNGGNDLSQSVTLNLPEGATGSLYLIGQTDAEDEIFEVVNGGEDNNFFSIPINIVLGDWADLFVTSVDLVPDTIFSGSYVPLGFTVHNNGAETIVGGNWLDRTYISTGATLPTNSSSILFTSETVQTLGPGESYSYESGFTAPLILGGNPVIYNLFVRTDLEDVIYEHLSANENNITIKPVVVMPAPPVDFVSTLASTLPDTVTAATEETISWTIVNEGSTTEVWPISTWEDAIYVSTDQVLTSESVLAEAWARGGEVGEGESYEVDQTFLVPPQLESGWYYFHVVADHNKVTYDGDTINNNLLVQNASMTSTALYVEATPAPDLEIISLQTLTAPIAGQPMEVLVSVINNGPGAAMFNWTDKIYLSTDLQLDNGDAIISTKAHTPVLDAGAFYQDTLEVFLPNTAVGNYVMIVKTNANNTMYEANFDNNLNTVFIQVLQQSPSDLVPDIFAYPDTVFVQGMLDFEYVTENFGEFPAVGYRKDIYYLSMDDSLDVDDAIIGEAEFTDMLLTPLAVDSFSFSGVVPGVQPGSYYLIVQSDALNNISEDDEDNNEGYTATKIEVTVPELPIGITLSNTMTNEGKIYYQIIVPDSLEGETMLVTYTGEENAFNNLYLSHEMVPTQSDHDYASDDLLGATREIIIPELSVGTYYLLATGVSTTATQQDATFLAEIINFQLRFVEANEGGNTGSVTLNLEGAKFEENMMARIEDNVLGTITASNLFYINSTQVFATFDLNGATLGLYDVTVENMEGEISTLADTFAIVNGDAGGSSGSGGGGSGSGGFYCSIDNFDVGNLLVTNYIHPASVRENRLVPIVIQYGNNGNVDIPTPIRFMLSVDGAPLSFTIEDLPEHKLELLLEFIEVGGPPDILRPGATGSITVYTRSSRDWELIFYIQE